MGIPVLIMGESGSGKSTSLRNFTTDEIGIFNVAGKPLPFRNQLKVSNNARYQGIAGRLHNRNGSPINTFVIDDSQYLMAFQSFALAKEKGFDKFTSIAVDFFNLVQAAIAAPPDYIVYFLHHTEQADTGKVKAKTIGKMIDQQLTLEGLFSIVLLCRTDGQRYWMETQSDGFTTAKSPMDMFSQREIDNDLKLVDTTIREYWNLPPLASASVPQNSARPVQGNQTSQKESAQQPSQMNPQTSVNQVENGKNKVN